jgi:hypothetical protein
MLTSKKLLGALPFLGAAGQLLPGRPPKGTKGTLGVPSALSEAVDGCRLGRRAGGCTGFNHPEKNT